LNDLLYNAIRAVFEARALPEQVSFCGLSVGPRVSAFVGDKAFLLFSSSVQGFL
jgi:hypothetical protein